MSTAAAFLSGLFSAAPVFLQTASAVIAAASAVTALTPTPRDDVWIGRLYQVLEVLALNIGRAKETAPNRRER